MRFIPKLIPGKAWAVECRSGSKKTGTYLALLVSEPIYTKAQAELVAKNMAIEFRCK